MPIKTEQIVRSKRFRNSIGFQNSAQRWSIGAVGGGLCSSAQLAMPLEFRNSNLLAFCSRIRSTPGHCLALFWSWNLLVQPPLRPMPLLCAVILLGRYNRNRRRIKITITIFVHKFNIVNSYIAIWHYPFPNFFQMAVEVFWFNGIICQVCLPNIKCRLQYLIIVINW